MRFRIVCDLIAHTRPKREDATILELGVELTADAKQGVALDAPVAGFVPGRVLDHSNADITELLRAPPCQAGLAFVFGTLNLRPIGSAEGD